MNYFCGKCGTALDSATGFCPNCDYEKLKSVGTQNVTTNTPNFCSCCGSTIDRQTGLCPNCSNTGTGSYQEQVPQTEIIKKQKPQKSRAATTVITVFLSIFLFLSMALSISIYSTRNAIKEDNFEKLFDNVNILDLFNNNNGNNDLERFYADISYYYNIEINDQKLERFIEKSTIKSFAARKLSGFADDFFEDYAEVKLTEREILNLLKSNASLINDEFGVRLTDSEMKEIAKWIIDEEEIVILNISDFKYDYSGLYFFLSIAVSYITMTIFIVLAALIIFFMIRNSLSQAICGISINLIIFGGVISIISLLTAWAPVWEIICGNSFVGMIIGNAVSVNALLGLIFLIIGIVALIIRKIFINRKKKLYNI